MIPSHPNFLADHGTLALWPVAGLALALVLYLLVDGVRDWMRKRHMAKVLELRRQNSRLERLTSQSSPFPGAPKIEYFEMTCRRCDKTLIIDESLRSAEISCPQCNEAIGTGPDNPTGEDAIVQRQIMARIR